MSNMDNFICKICQLKNTIEMDIGLGEYLCTECGTVYKEFKEMIIDEDEKRTNHDENGDNQIHRVGPPMRPENENGYGTTIVRENGKTHKIRHFTKITKLQKNFNRINKILKKANVNEQKIEYTKTLYEKISKNQNMRGKKIKRIILGIYYYVCRKIKNAKTYREIASEFTDFEEFKDFKDDELKKKRIIVSAYNSIKKDIIE